MRHDTLTAKDWIAAGFRALTAGGPQAIKIEAIARELAVSKGSLLDFFKNANPEQYALSSRMRSRPASSARIFPTPSSSIATW